MAFLDINKHSIQVGQSLPSVELIEGTPLYAVNISEICKGKKVILLGSAGAFIPGSSADNFSRCIDKADELRHKGIDEIICVTVNDVFVTEAWGLEHDHYGKVRMLADPDADFTKAIGLEVLSSPLGGYRSKVYIMAVEDNIVKQLVIDPDENSWSTSGLSMSKR